MTPPAMAEPAAPYTVASDSETTTGGGEDKTSSYFPEIAIGIDIGTSQCSVAVWNGSQVELLKNTRQQKLMRSYVTFKDNTDTNLPSAGAAIFNVKRLLGRLDTDPVVLSTNTLMPFLVHALGIGARPMIAALVNGTWRSTTPEEVLAVFLVELRAMAELQLKHSVRNVVLTVPVSFTRFQLSRVERACAMAGLRVLRLMPEPTAVALLYAQQQQTIRNEDVTADGEERIVLIFNMGAGYSDAAVSATAGGVSQIRSLAGCAVGGEDILQNTIRHLLPEADELFACHGVDEIRAIGILRIAAQDAIHRLSISALAEIDVELGIGRKVSRVLEREEFEEVNREVFENCCGLITRCLRDAKLEAEDINDVILVGGCSCIPKVKDMVLTLCKRSEIYRGVSPLEAAVSGAALEGAVASGISDPFGNLDLLTIQVTPLSIGIRTEGGVFAPIVWRNTTMPARKEAIFTTGHDNQAEALVVVYEGEGGRVEENNFIGYLKLAGIPPAPKGVPEISVCMDIDAANVLRVFAGVVVKPGAHRGAAVVPFMEVRMPTVEDGHGWCAEALDRTYGSALDLVSTVQKKI